MKPGKARKRIIKLGRRIPVEEIRAFVENGVDSRPQYFVLRQYGYELLCPWRAHFGAELTLDDDVLYHACKEYLKERHLVFESTDTALDYARTHGLL